MAAATASAYPNSSARNSGKNAPLFTRESLENLFENCDLRPHHVNMLLAMWRAAGKPTGNEIFLFAAVEGYRIEARYKSRRSVQYNLRALESEKIGVIELVHGANTIRRPATYRLRTDRLGRRQTYQDAKNHRKSPHSISRNSTPVSPVPSPEPAREPAQAAAPQLQPSVAPVAVVEPIRANQRPPRRLTPREGPKLVSTMLELMRGHTRHQQVDGYAFDLKPDDPRYRPKLGQSEALEEACRTLGIPLDAAEEHLKLCQWKFEKPEESP